MAESKTDQPLVPSILDRLLDFDPEVRREPPRNQNQTLRELKKAVRRDLENLLNTRVRCIPYPPELKELKTSMVSYGIPDLTGASFGSSKEREEFRKTVHTVIVQFETRLKKLTVRLLDSADSAERIVRFEIDAILLAEPASERIVFDSSLRLATGAFELKGEGNG